MSLRRKLVGLCLAAALVAPALPARAEEPGSGWLDWTAAVWQEVLALLPGPAPTEGSPATQPEPSGELNAALSIEPSG